jgi:hypothetical protein
MADGPPLSHRAMLSMPDRAMTGCCKVARAVPGASAPLAKPETKPAEDWSRLVAELSPAISKCVIDGGIAVDQVLQAWPMNRGKVGVRLQDRTGTPYDCVTDQTGKGSAKVTKTKATALPASGMPVFLPAREQPPMVSCGRLERVEAGGNLVGWLHYDSCN